MQLIQLIEPTSINIKKDMSTLGEAIENNQINGAIVDKENDVCGKISPNKIVIVSNNGEITKDDNSIKEQLEDIVKSLNGIVKTNGDAQTISEDSHKIETEINAIIADGSAPNKQSNESSSFESCKSTNGNSGDIDTAVDDYINFENKAIDLNDEVISSDKEPVSSDPKETDVSLNKKAVDDAISIENKIEAVDAQAVVSSDEVSEAEKSKSIEIFIENDDMASNVSTFSPNSDTNEEISISAQLQQLENDASIEDSSKTHPKENTIIAINQSKTLESESLENNDVQVLKKCEESSLKNENEFKIGETVSSNDNPESPGQIENILLTERNEISDASDIDTDKLPVGDQSVDVDIALEMDLEITPTDNKPDDDADNSIEGPPSIENNTEDKSSIEKVNDNGEDIPANIREKNEVLDAATSEKSTICSGEVDMEVDDCKPIEIAIELIPKLESSKSEDACVEKEVSVQKYITVKKFTDMVYPTACTTTTAENIELTDISDGKLTQIDQVRKNEVMEVDAPDKVLLVTPKNISSDISDQKPPVMSTKVEMVKEKLDEDTIMERALVVSEEDEVMSIEPQEINDAVMEIDSVVSETKDCGEVPTVEKIVSDIVFFKDKTEDLTVDDKTCDTPSTVINIIDNDDEAIKSSTQECSSVKNSDASDVISIEDSVKDAISEESLKSSGDVEIMNDLKIIEEKNTQNPDTLPEQILEKPAIKPLPVVCKLSNTMDILSDDEEDLPVAKPSNENKILSETLNTAQEQNKCINIDDDDDIMFIEDTNSQEAITEGGTKPEQHSDNAKSQKFITNTNDIEPASTENKISSSKMLENEEPKLCEKDSTTLVEVDSQPEVNESKPVEPIITQEAKPLITKNFLKSVTKNLSDMTRNELEDFCILKLVESVVDKSNLSEIKNKMKTMAQTVEDLRKKTVALTKQNRDLQVVVKTVQEDQRKRNANPMMPMKITRSVGMQVVLSIGEKAIPKKKLNTPAQAPPSALSRPVRNMQTPKTQKPSANNIPVPRLVPAISPTVKSPATQVINTKPTVTPARNTTPQRPEKRPHNKQSPASSVTVDLTDDEPPAKINTRNPTPPVRLVPSQSLMPPKNKPQFAQAGNSPRKVYIPISSSNHNVRPPAPAPAVMKNFVPTPRPRQPSVVRMQTLRVNQLPSTSRHPAPLPDAMKQYQPPAWKALPPAPDLKLSKVDNGIVISWKFEGYQPETYEEVASFQLYAYQETTAPPSTALWKKIGDIKALPLPMACTLTQFMSGFKYYFAVRAIDVRSRIGPFSLPGSILLISKN